MYYDELSARSEAEAADYFVDHKRDDVDLVRVDLVGPDEIGTREFAHTPVSSFDPLMAHRQLDRNEHVR